nr:hypothetical protein [Tanacetum cinerariifolium]
MVFCLEKTEENSKFHHIVDFLSTCSINYALTVSDLEDVRNCGGEETKLTTQALRNHIRGVDAQTRFETASKRSSNPPLSTGHTDESGKARMEQETDLTDFIPPTPYDSPFLGGHTPESDESRPNINELMNLCTQLSNRVLALEQFKTAQNLVIKRLQTKVKRLEKKQRARTLGIKLFKIGTSKEKTLDKENDVNAAKPVPTTGDAVNAASVIPDVSAIDPFISTAEDIFEDEMTTMANTLITIRRTRPRTTSVVIHDVEEEPRKATPPPIVQSQNKGKGKMVESEPISKNPIKAQIQRDAEIAQRLFKEKQAQFEREQRIARQKAT